MIKKVKKMNMKKLTILLIVSSSFLVLLAVTPSTAKVTDTLADIKARGYMIVGADTAYDPFESIDPSTSLPVGFDVDLSVILADALGVDVTWRTSAWDPIIPNLKAGNFDMIISAMTITEAREVEVDFTRWYYKSFQAWLTKASFTDVAVEADLNTTGLRVGLQLGTTSHGYANDSLQAATIQAFDTVPLAINALTQGSVDVVLGDYAVLAKASQTDTSLAVGGTFSPEDFGIAVRSGEDTLRNALNTALDGLLGPVSAYSPSDAYNAIYFQNFGVNAPDYTGSVTSTALPNAVLKYDKGGTSPGFEFVSLFLAIALVPIIRKTKK